MQKSKDIDKRLPAGIPIKQKIQSSKSRRGGRAIRAVQRLERYSRGVEFQPQTRSGSHFASSEILPPGYFGCSGLLSWVNGLRTISLWSLAVRRLCTWKICCNSFSGHWILPKIRGRSCTIWILLFNNNNFCRWARADWAGWIVMRPLPIACGMAFVASKRRVTKWLTLLTKAWQWFIYQLLYQSVAIGQKHIDSGWQIRK